MTCLLTTLFVTTVTSSDKTSFIEFRLQKVVKTNGHYLFADQKPHQLITMKNNFQVEDLLNNDNTKNKIIKNNHNNNNNTHPTMLKINSL